MSARSEYAVVRQADGAFRLDRTTQPGSGPVAYARPVFDRTNTKRGWRLQPIRIVRGSATKVWPTAAEALASTTLLTLGQAKAAILAGGPPGGERESADHA